MVTDEVQEEFISFLYFSKDRLSRVIAQVLFGYRTRFPVSMRTYRLFLVASETALNWHTPSHIGD